ncbi:MAG TPA: ATP-binding protein [Candidatus Eisenbacteria bacterium]|nr:ATP-binding protein [Candidatus Eisenbacteria bacterium]
MRLPISLRASLSLSMVGLAVLVAMLAIGVHLTLAVQEIIHASAERSRALAHQTAWLAGRAARASSASIPNAIQGDRALKSLFESAVAGDPTIYDLTIVDRRGVVLVHSQGLRVGQLALTRPDIEALEEGNVFRQGARLLGPSRAFEARVPLNSGGRPFGEVRVGLSTALMKTALLESLRAGLWVTAVALLLAILVALISAELLSRRVRAMTTGLERLRGGDFDYRLQVEGRDELSVLASSINALGERLEAMRHRAAAGEVDHDELLDATGQASAWARVARGLTHELADSLHAAQLHLGHLRAKWNLAPDDAQRHLEVVDQEFGRLKTVLERFRGFSQRGEMRPDWVDLQGLLEEEVDRARQSMNPSIEIRLDARSAPERFWGDGLLLRQAITQLITNAVQAMPDGGRVTVRVDRHGGRVAVTVKDDGAGIPEELHGQVFDEDFTTKPRGSGVGLAVVQKVVKLHKGRVRLHSAPGQGTEVVLELPESKLEPVGAA